MDKATMGGLALTIVACVFVITHGGPLSAFWDPHGLIIILGGTFGSLGVNYPMEHLRQTLKVIRKVFTSKLEAPVNIVKRITEYASQARRDGVLALESQLDKEPDPFLKRGLQLVVDGQDVDAIEELLQTDMDQMKKRHEMAKEVFSQGAALSPAMGLLATLIALVQMLGAMDDPSSIGPKMAMALVGTFYGAYLSNAVYMPIAGKLSVRSAEEIKKLQLEGIRQIASGTNPRNVEAQLLAFLAPKARVSQFS
jgi:chemotaxis protein MotA